MTLLHVLLYNDAQDEAYVPKRLRNVRRTRTYSLLEHFFHAMTDAISHIFTMCATRIENWKTHSAINKRRSIATTYYRIIGNRAPPWRTNARSGLLTAQAALLAQQAKQESTSKRQNLVCFDDDSNPIGVDNRATAFMSGEIDDFEGALNDTNRVVKGFGGSRTTGAKIGTARIRFEDDSGLQHTFLLPNSYYIPGVKDRLFSPQHWAQSLHKKGIKNARETTNAYEVKLLWSNFSKTIPLDRMTNVATFNSASGSSKFMAFCTEAGFRNPSEDLEPISYPAVNYISDEEAEDDLPQIDFNLETKDSKKRDKNLGRSGGVIEQHIPNTRTSPRQAALIEEDDIQLRTEKMEAELLQFHYRFGHAPFSKLQEMARQGLLPRRLRNCRIPVCAACMYGKATKRPWRQKTPLNNDTAQTNAATAPGQVVSVDQLESPTLGFIAQLTGKLTTSRYRCATVFVDHFSGLGFIFLQKSTTGAETLDAKKAFERVCENAGHHVGHYHADNGIFRAHAWTSNCREKGQSYSFAGVDAHHQNGRAEARIRRLQEMARTMINHAKRRWPQEVAQPLWPYALRMACDSINATTSLRDKSKRTPDEIFFSTPVSSNPKNWRHPFCPVYVLHKSLASGRHLSKWSDRARVGLYLGPSPQHARNVSLVLDIRTGLVSPQFHIKFDTNFDTIKELYKEQQNHVSEWQLRAGFLKKGATTTTEVPIEVGINDKLASKQVEKGKQVPRAQGVAVTNSISQQPSNHEPQEEVTTSQRPSTVEVQTQREVIAQQHSPTPTAGERAQRRSRRPVKPVDRLIHAMQTELSREDEIGELFSHLALSPDLDTNDILSDIVALKAKADPDTLYVHEARKQPDWKNFEDAMQLEIEQQVNLGIYEIVRIRDIPKGATILPAVWQLRRKRDTRTGAIKKYKARCNIDGSRMKYGEHYEETYAPVAGWTAIRLLLALVLLLKWETVQLDYVLAFPQAPAVRDLYMRIPNGFTLDGVENPSDYVLRIKRNIYGGKDAGRTWFLYLKERLERVGFEQSKHDDCMFFKGNMVYVLYTDDSILAGPNRKEIDEAIEQMQAIGLTLTIKGDLDDFLGVNFDRRTDGSIKLSQPKLIEQILSDLRMSDDSTKTKSTPAASSKLVSRHNDSEPFDHNFNYRSVIGKMHYLVAGSRSEIAYAVHQCARFAHDTKREHGQAVRWIGRYLKGTITEGTILRPQESKGLEVYVDSDFAGNWDPKIAGEDRSTARSRHGFFICYAGVPITYKSSLQQEIALSSTEAEITGLSYALREAIPVIRILSEMQDRGYPINKSNAKVHCKVFEDNSGAIEIARTHKYRPRTKFLNNKLFHFRTYVDRGIISIHPIGTKDQPADILTKPLNEEAFKRHRLAMNGW